MKVCPACRTQYSDDTLSFCLQDGTPMVLGFDIETPTVVLGEVETEAVRRDRVNVPIDPASAAWQQSQVTNVATLRPPEKRTSTAVAVAATAVGMLCLFGVIGIAAWIFVKNSGQQVPQNANNTSNGERNDSSNITLPTPWQTATATPVSTRVPSIPTTNITPQPTVPELRDDEQAKSEVSGRVNDWKSMLESRNFSGYMGNYADTVDYYSRRNVSVGSVRADKSRAFSLYSSMRVNVSNMDVMIGPTGDTATVVFDKEWNFSGRDTSSGKVRSQLGFRNINGRWLITSEKDLKVYYTR